METVTGIKDLMLESVNQMATNIASVAPKIIFAVLILLIGWIIIKIVAFALKRTLNFAKS